MKALTFKYRLFAVIAVALTALDQLTKWLVIQYVPYRTGEIHVIPGWLDIIHTRNTGAAFGMLNDFQWRQQLFLVFTIVALGVLIHMLWQLPEDDRFQTTAIGMIASGAVGNLIDRLRFSYVTDFIRVYTEVPSIRRWLVEQFRTNEWPSFNVADAAIVVGIGLFFVHWIFIQKDDKDLAADPPARPLDEPAGGPGGTGPTSAA